MQCHSCKHELSVASLQVHLVDSILCNYDNHNEYIKLSKCGLAQKESYALRKKPSDNECKMKSKPIDYFMNTLHRNIGYTPQIKM